MHTPAYLYRSTFYNADLAEDTTGVQLNGNPEGEFNSNY